MARALGIEGGRLAVTLYLHVELWPTGDCRPIRAAMGYPPLATGGIYAPMERELYGLISECRNCNV